MEKDLLVAELEKSANEITAKVKGITDPLDLRLKQIEEAVKNGSTVDPALKSEVENLAQKHADFVSLVDGRMAELKTISSKGKDNTPLTLYKAAEIALNEERKGEDTFVQQIKDIKEGKASRRTLTMELKAVGTMTTGVNAGTTYFAGFDQPTMVKVPPLFDPHIRPYLPSNTTDRNVVRYVREVSTQGAPGMTAEGALKPQMDFTFDEQDANVRKIAGYMRIAEEMIDDIPYLLTYLTGRGLQNLKNVEDYQILHGDGTGQNLAGFDATAVAFAAGTTITATPNEFDVFVAAKKQLRNAYLQATHIFVNPDDYASMRLKKTTYGEPLFPYLADMQTITVDGTPVIQNTRVVSGSFYVIDATCIEIIDRMQTQIRLFDQDQDNAIKNLITVVIEERLALATYRNNAIVKGTFTAAFTDLTS